MAYAIPVVACTAMGSSVDVNNLTGAMFDGVTVTSGQRVLLTQQTTASQNGVWIFNGTGPTNPMTRPAAPDPYQTGNVLDNDTLISVKQGNTLAGTCWGVDPAQVITVDTTDHTLTRVALPDVQARVATTGLPGTVVDVTSTTYTSIDGIPLSGNGGPGSDIVLVTDQGLLTTPAPQNNGLYWFKSGAPMVRTSEPLTPMRRVSVSEGNLNAHNRYQLVSKPPIILGTSAITFALQNLVFNVQDFGATGNGVTDDTAAINAALTCASSQASNNNSGTVFFPLGTYLISNTIKVPNAVNLRGAGTDATTIELSSAVSPSLDAIVGGSYSNISDFNVNHGPTRSISNWSPESSAFSVGQYVAPAAPSSVLLKCVSGTGPTGANAPFGQLLSVSFAYLSGIPDDNYQLDVRIVTTGFLGVMQFQTSLNGGATWGSTQSTPPGNLYCYPIPDTGGVSVTFAGGDNPYEAGSIIQPTPVVVASGTPNSSTYNIDVGIVTSGPLGTMTFEVSTTGDTHKYLFGTTFGQGGTGLPGVPVSTTAGASFCYPIPGTGITLTFYAGDYSVDMAPFSSPSFGWSMIQGTQIVDSGYTWEVVAGGAAIDIMSLNVGTACGVDTIRRVTMFGGVANIILDEAEGVVVEDCQFYDSTMAAIWITNGPDHIFGSGFEFSNELAIRGTNQFWTRGYGVIYDGGFQLEISGSPNFQTTLAGWIYIANAYGLSIHGCYIESPGGIVRDTAFNSRTSVHGSEGFTFHGNSADSVRTSTLDFWAVNGFAATGNFLSGATAAFTGCDQVVNFFEAGNYNNSGTPICDTSPGNVGLSLTNGARFVGTVGFVSVPMTLATGSNANVPVTASTAEITGPSGPFSTSGFAAGGLMAGYDGQRMTVRNRNGQQWTIQHQNAGSLAGNRIICASGFDTTLLDPGSRGFSAAEFEYSAADGAWVVLSTTGLQAFTPLQIPGVQCWLRGDNMVLDNEGNVSRWPDLSGHGSDAAQPVAGSRPSGGGALINGQPTVGFTAASSQFLYFFVGFNSLAGAHAFVVMRNTASPPAAGNGLWLCGTSGAPTFVPYTDNVIHDDFGSPVPHTCGTAVSSLALPTIYEVTSGPGMWTNWLNSVVQYTTSSNTVLCASSPTLGWNQSAAFEDGVIAEVIIFDTGANGPLNGDLTDGQRSQILNYLAARYAITL